MQNLTRPSAQVIRLLTGSLVCVALLTAAMPAHGYESLTQIIARWQEYVKTLMEEPREVRVPQSKQFFKTVPWDNIEYLCFEGSNGVGPDSASVMEFVLGYRLEVMPPAVEELVEFFRNPNCIHHCKKPLLVWATTNRDNLAAAERELLAATFLGATELPNMPRQFLDRLHVGAASLTAGDTIMSTMMTGARAADTLRARRALHMLGASIDPRAPDSLAAIMQELRAARSSHYDTAIDVCRVPCATRALDLLATSYREPWTLQQRLRSLITLASVPTLGGAQVILDGYGDGGQVADSTFATQGEARAHYYELWLATRIAEPHLLEWLRSGPPAARPLAVELLDRALRFGPLDDDQAVVNTLAELMEQAEGTLAARAAAAHERALAPPQADRRRPLAREHQQ